jgi:hypothetical protein
VVTEFFDALFRPGVDNAKISVEQVLDLLY